MRPGNYLQASLATGIHRDTVTRAWNVGLTLENGRKYPPLKRLVRTRKALPDYPTAPLEPRQPRAKPEQPAQPDEPTPEPTRTPPPEVMVPMARAKAQRVVISWEQFQAEALAQRADLTKIMKGATQLLGANLQALGKIAPSIIRVAEMTAVAMTKYVELRPVDGIDLLERYTKAVSVMQGSLRNLQISTATHYGQPSSYVKIQHEVETPDTGDLTVGDMLREIDRVAESAKAIRGTVVEAADLDNGLNGNGEAH